MRRVSATLALVLAVTASNAAEPPERNPFQIPIDLEDPVAVEAGMQPETVPEPLRLRATLLAGARSSVILDGAILTIGEEYSGYRLVSVHEGEAVLSKNGEAVRLFVDDSDE